MFFFEKRSDYKKVRGSVKPVGNSGDVVEFRSRDFKPEVPKGPNKILRTI